MIFRKNSQPKKSLGRKNFPAVGCFLKTSTSELTRERYDEIFRKIAQAEKLWE